MTQDTSSTGVLNMLFGWVAGLIIKVALIGAVVGGVIATGAWFLFR